MGAEKLAAALIVNRGLRSLELRSNRVGAKGASELAAALQSNCKLSSLGLRYNSIGAEGIERLAAAWKHNDKLTNLQLDITDAGEHGATHVISCLAGKELHNRWVRRGREGGSGVIKVHKRSFVKEILYGCEWGAVVREFLREPPVTELHLSRNGITLARSQARYALCNLLPLRHLDLSHNDIEGSLDKLGQLINLEAIDLSNNNLTSIDLALFTLPNLKICNIKGNLNLKQPPVSVSAKPLKRLRQYARRRMSMFNTVKLAVVGDANVGKTLLTYHLMGNDEEADSHMNLDRSRGDHNGETRGVHHEKLMIELGKGFEHDYLQLLIWDYVSCSVVLS